MQLKNLKNKILLIFTAVIIVLSGINFCYADTTQPDSPKQTKPAASAILPSKKENKNILGKFFTTMLWVISSCIIIYGVLVLYKKYKCCTVDSEVREKEIALNLESPASVDDAIDFVIKKF